RLGAFVEPGTVCFDLPPAPGATPSGGYPIPAADGSPGSRVYAVAAAEADTSPWEQLTLAEPAGEPVPRAARHPTKRTGWGPAAWVLAGGLLGACALAVGVLVRALGK